MRGMLAAILGLALFVALPPRPTYPTPVTQVAGAPIAPDYISVHDKAIYQSIFSLQANGEFATAETMLPQVENPILTGHVLAQRYLDGRYNTSKDELVGWLSQYGDHPEAKAIRALARTKGAGSKELPGFDVAGDALRGNGSIDQIGAGRMPDGWYRGLSLWKEQNYDAAASIFAGIGRDEALSDWQRAAGYYWAFRSESRLGDTDTAHGYLKEASEYPTTFYGLLAARQRGDAALLTATAPHVPQDIRSNGHTLRARALTVVGQTDIAEDELRQLYSELGSADRPAIVTLASELNLANLEVRLSRMSGLSDSEQLFAAYPMPSWISEAQQSVDPALVMAIARQESVFRDEAKNGGSGALGMMQMLPSTAHSLLMHLKHEGSDVASEDFASLPVKDQLTDPERSVLLGAEYVRLLMKQPAVGGSLIKVLAAYNAGPGSVLSWQAAGARMEDPLLYLESIPFAETHNYVMQVMAHYWVYQSLMGKSPAGLDALARGEWPQLASTRS